MRINAEYVQTVPGVTVNGRQYYFILCRWFDHETQKAYSFESTLFAADPALILEEKKITSIPVYIKPGHPNVYFMDTSIVPDLKYCE